MPRARDVGIHVGILPPGPLNAITDVPGVAVGHRTRVDGDDVRTGVTVVVPHGGDLFQQKAPAAICVGNGFGKLAGSTQVDELGELETPVALVANHAMNHLFAAVVEATEETVYNALLQATTTSGRDGRTRQAIPVDRVVEICRRYGVLDLRQRLPRVEGRRP